MRKSIFAAVLGVGVSTSVTPAAAEKPLLTEIVVVESADRAQEYSLTGDIRARDSVSAAFPVAGRISEVLVDVGQTVTAGTILARMDSVQQQQALRAAEAGLNTATADHRQAQEDLTRAEALLARGATTRAARDAAEDKLQAATGALAQAKADLDRARKTLNDTELRAPEDATVTARKVEAGQVVGAAQPVIELALSNGVEAVFDVPEVLLTGSAAPTAVRLSRLSEPDVTFPGRISEISPLVDPSTGTVAVTVKIDSPPQGLTYGEPVRGTATVTEPDRIVLPYTVLSSLGDGPAVWLVDPADNRVHLVPIAVDRYETGQIVLISGVSPGDRVVAKGVQLLYPGRLVTQTEAQQ